MLRVAAIGAGLLGAALFIAAGVRSGLQMYGDGSLFSYAVTVQDSWAFHWHNIPGRAAVYFLCLWPAEAFVALTGDPRGGVVVYGLLFFAAPLLALIATHAADRSAGRMIFAYGCFSTAALCPLVFGFPTEMWLAHALFWPTLAVTHYASKGIAGFALSFALLLTLIFTHEGAIILAASIVATLLMRSHRDSRFARAALALAMAIPIWVGVKTLTPTDDYFAAVFDRAALHFFDPAILKSGFVLLLLFTFAGYGVAFLVFTRVAPAKAHIYACAVVAMALAIYWIWFDHSLHAENRYYMRTALVAATPVLGALAALFAIRADGRLTPRMEKLVPALSSVMLIRAVTGAFILLVLVHIVETAKFDLAWAKYKSAVAGLATGAAADPLLGDAHFVSSVRIAKDLNRLSWNSTTPFLSVLMAKFAPARLVVDPSANYFWLSCKTATANFSASRLVPAESRRLVLLHACLHR